MKKKIKKVGKVANLTFKQVDDALEESHGMITPAAKKLGISRPTLYKRIKKSVKLQENLEEYRDQSNDYVESLLWTKMEAGCTTSIIFWLKCRAKWNDRPNQNIQIPVDGGIKPIIVLQDNSDK